LKSRSPADYQKIKLSILKHGIVVPFFVWRNKGHNWVIDGTGRTETLLGMEEEGYNIPDLPVVFIKAKNEVEAKEILLKINSHYGRCNCCQGVNGLLQP